MWFHRPALSWSQKRTIHTQELLRRMKNTSKSLDKSIKNEILTKYMWKMKYSGYNQKFRSECLLSAKNAFKILIRRHEQDGTSIFRNRNEMVEFKAKKNRTPSNWWKASTNKNKEFTAVMFVPPTPGGELVKS